MSLITNTKLYLINFITNIDNFSGSYFLRLQDANGCDDYENMEDDYTHMLEGFQNMFLTHRSGRVETYPIENHIYNGINKTNYDEDEEEDDYENKLYKNFKSFQKWNMECILKLSNEDAKFIKLLCKKILNRKVNMYLNVPWDASGVYFNKKGKLIVIHPI
jgi:hypothetical protein